MNKAQSLISEILKSIKFLIKQAMNDTTKIYNGVVKGIADDGKIIVKLNGGVYILPLYGSNEVSIGDVLKVFVPQGNFNLAYCDSRKSNGGGGGGTNDHSKLVNRNILNQHPISAITGLQDKIDEVDSGYITPEKYGAKGNGSNDDTEAFNKAIQECQNKNKGFLTQINKDYKISKVTFQGIKDIKLNGTIIGDINIYGNSRILNIFISNCEGVVTLAGLSSSDIIIQKTQKLRLIGDSNIADNNFIGYSKFWLGNINNFEIEGITSNAWINENTFFGGRFEFFKIFGATGFSVAENLFFKPMCENTDVRIELGNNNIIYDARLEGTRSKIFFGNDAKDNLINTNYSTVRSGYYLNDDFLDHLDLTISGNINDNNLHRNNTLKIKNGISVSYANNPRNIPIENGKLMVSTSPSKIYESEKAPMLTFPFCLLFYTPDKLVGLKVNCYDSNQTLITFEPNAGFVFNSSTVYFSNGAYRNNITSASDRVNYFVAFNPIMDDRIKYINISFSNKSGTVLPVEYIGFDVTSYKTIPNNFIQILSTPIPNA